MPFTVSHASAIIPLNRKPFVLSALIIGSMSPDFLYFIPFVPDSHFTYTVPGLFLFCLPASFVALLIYHKLLERPLISLLPRFLRSRLQSELTDFKFLPLSNLLLTALSVFLGALTHIVWDSFTHATGQAVLLLPFLAQPVFTVAGETIFLYKLLQYVSTVLGLLVFTIWCARKVLQSEPRPLPEREAVAPSSLWLFTMIAVASVTGLIYGLSWLQPYGFKSFVVQTVIGSMSTFIVLLMLFSCVWHVRRRWGGRT